MKTFISSITTLLVIFCTSLTVFASYWTSNVGGGTWRRGREDGPKEAYSYYYHSRRTHGATSQTDLAPGATSRRCAGSDRRAESRSNFVDPRSCKPYWHMCKDTHDGNF